MSSQKTIAFFGATGGTGLSALLLSLKNNHNCRVLVRNPQKLHTLLEKSYPDITNSPPQNLTTIIGTADDETAISSTLSDNNGKLVDVIIYTIGGTPVLNGVSLRPTLDDPTITGRTSATILRVLSSLSTTTSTNTNSSKIPLFVTCSTTGLRANVRDVPLLFKPLYKYFLAIPHDDKQVMEDNISSSPLLSGGDAGEKGGNYIILRPSLLTDGEYTYGLLRAGYEGRTSGDKGTLDKEGGGSGWKGEKGVAVGYTVSRNDVGAWVYEECVVKDGGEWRGKRVTLTY